MVGRVRSLSALSPSKAEPKRNMEPTPAHTTGQLAEASGENVWMVRDGVVHTPALGGSLLGGIVAIHSGYAA